MGRGFYCLLSFGFVNCQLVFGGGEGCLNTIKKSSELMDQVATIINPEKAFSDKTIDTIIQLNSFCYYFEKNRDDFYRNGYSKNIKSCKDIVTTLGSDEKIPSGRGVK